MRRLLLSSLVALAGGCAAHEQAQRELIGEMRQAVSDVRIWNDERQSLIEQQYQRQRRNLDAAFDQDAHQAPALDAEWVIEARKAYLAGLEAIWTAQQSSSQAHQQAQQNLRAVDEGLARLAMASELREGIWQKAEEAIHGND